MKRFYLLMALAAVGFINFGYNVTARAAGFEPIVAEFDGNLAVNLEVGTGTGDSSWMSLIFEDPIDPSDYPYLYISFGIYRFSGSGSNNGWIPWAFNSADFAPCYGGQNGDTTFPFVGSGGTTGTAPTVTDQYGVVGLGWDFAAGTCSSFYNDDTIDDEILLINPPADPAPLTGFTITLEDNNADGEVIWIDDFLLIALNDDYSEAIIYDYFYDDYLCDNDLELGALNGQGLTDMGHWEAGANNPVPLPGAVWLLGSGLIGLVGIRRRKKE